MGTWHVLSSLLIAGGALYGLGLPVAWLFPAPATAQWVQRIAIAPVLAIALTSPIAMGLALLDVRFQPWTLLVLAVGAWALAYPRMRRQWRDASRGREWQWPLAMVAAAAYGWFLALRPYGLYLPNRDFKNHAYNVAQFAFDRMAHPLHTYAPGPLSEPEVSGFTRIGLHTLLAWALPTGDWNSLGVTAAAALLPTIISLPLGLIALARIWRPDSTLLWKLAGACGVLFPSFTGPFSIGSVSLLFGAALFPAALAALWHLVLAPDRGRLALVVAVGLGMALTHIPEAAGLGLLFVISIPWIVGRMNPERSKAARRALTIIAIALVVAPAAVMFTTFPYLSEQRRDIQANDGEAWLGALYPIVAHPDGPGLLRLLAAGLVLLGIWMTLRERLRPEPVIVLAVFAFVSLGASWAGAPGWMQSLASPWYGSASRASILAGAAVVLLACLPVSVAGEALAAGAESTSRRALAPLGLLLVGLVAIGFGRFQVEQRQLALASTLAGAGDTPAIADRLSGLLEPGETVLNLESDGSTNLFSAARVPTAVALWVMETLPDGDSGR